MNFSLPLNFSSPLWQTQVNPSPVQDSSLDRSKRLDEAYQAQSGGGAGAAALARVQDTVLNRLVERIPETDASDLRNLDAADFTPEKVAERVGGFVAKGLENARAMGRTDAEVQNLYNSAMEGMEKGLAEAKDILKSLNVLQGGIAEQVDETAKRLRETLADLDPSRNRDQLEISGSSGTAAMSMSERYQSASSFELQVQTRDGDQVTLRFGQMSDFSTSASAYADSDGNRAASFSMSSTQQIEFGYQIEGNVDEQEMTALGDLVRDVNRMADDFFNGDVQKAFEQAGNLEFDGSQLASFELNMSQTQQYTAARAYTETQQIEQPDAGRPGLRLGQLMQGLRDSVNQDQLNFLDNPQQAAFGLLRGLVDQDTRMKDADPASQESMRARLEDLLSAVGQQTTEQQPVESAS